MAIDRYRRFGFVAFQEDDLDGLVSRNHNGPVG
jgi:hypothetical protein